MGLLHQQPLPQKLQALIQLSGAWSPDPLVDTQQFSVGGPGSVRAYPPSDIRGDKGYFTSLTLRRPFIIQQVTTFVSVFADHGRIMRVDADPGVSEEESLTSVGLGTELRWRQWSFKLDGAVPTDNHQASDGQDDYRFFGSLSVRF